MILGWDYLVFVAALSVAAFSPGPGLAAIVATVLAQGARKTVWFCLGIIIGDLVWLTLSLNGLALIAQQIPVIFSTLKWVGIAYLVWLAWKTWNSGSEIGRATVSAMNGPRLAASLRALQQHWGTPNPCCFIWRCSQTLWTPEIYLRLR